MLLVGLIILSFLLLMTTTLLVVGGVVLYFTLNKMSSMEQKIEVLEEKANEEENNIPDPWTMPVIPPEEFYGKIMRDRSQQARFAAMRRERTNINPPPPPIFRTELGDNDFTTVSFLPQNRRKKTNKEYSDNVIKVNFGNK